MAVLYWPALTHSTKRYKVPQAAQKKIITPALSLPLHVYLSLSFCNMALGKDNNVRTLFDQICSSPSWKASSWSIFLFFFLRTIFYTFFLRCFSCALWGENWPKQIKWFAIDISASLERSTRVNNEVPRSQRSRRWGRGIETQVVVNWSSSAALQFHTIHIDPARTVSDPG